jgi:Flp pilus assembly protein TadD
MPKPPDVTACLAEALTLHQAGRLADAEKMYKQILAREPGHAESLNWLGVIAHQRDHHAEAVRLIDLALKTNPGDVLALNNRGNALQALKRFEEALSSYDRALEVRPDFAVAHYNRGNTLHALARFDEALASYDRALALQPNYPEAHGNRGIALHNLKRFDEALSSYQRALALRPDFAEAHYCEALSRLLTGDLDRGWQEHEWRWRTQQLGHGRRNFVQPLWDGADDIAGKTILLHAEQGFGDTIQFCRYVPRVAERGARVILEVQKPLYELMGIFSGVADIVSRGDPLADFDMHCPLLSLPRAFQARLETIPSATPFLRAPAPAVAAWNARLPPRTRPRIGLAWCGRPTHNNDRNRSIELGTFWSLIDGVEAVWVSLQRDVRAGDATLLRERDDVLHFGEELQTFADTAALISNLDLVISVDTSVAHLAGALAKPVWVLLPFIPDWRWLLDRDDSPWYPTARLFRQDGSRRWDGALRLVREALRNSVG